MVFCPVLDISWAAAVRGNVVFGGWTNLSSRISNFNTYIYANMCVIALDITLFVAVGAIGRQGVSLVIALSSGRGSSYSGNILLLSFEPVSFPPFLLAFASTDTGTSRLLPRLPLLLLLLWIFMLVIF
jgi:hypothetical protein